MKKLFEQIKNKFNNLSKLTKVTLFVVFLLGFLGLILQNIYPEQEPSVQAITPVTEFGVSEDAKFTISFTKVLNKKTKKKLSLKIEPKIEANSYWKENNYQYVIEPSKRLTRDTYYTIKVYFKNKEIYSKKYLTSRYSAEEQAQQIKEQTKSDIEFNKAVKKLVTDYPWYKKMPIKEDQFEIVYDFKKKKFRIRLKVPKDTNQEIINNLTQKALSAMKNKGINTQEWGYYVLFTE